ncbi:MAG: response regulator [Treponema sp.]|nr:response regulator [Treponema sp.]
MEGHKIIIVVDDNDTNLVACKKILKPYYTVYPSPSAAKMFELLEHGIKPDLILLDVEMPDMDGYEAARILKSSKAYSGFPLMFLTARNDAAGEMEGLNLGALDYIHKPFVGALLLKRIENHLSLIERGDAP